MGADTPPFGAYTSPMQSAVSLEEAKRRKPTRPFGPICSARPAQEPRANTPPCPGLASRPCRLPLLYLGVHHAAAPDADRRGNTSCVFLNVRASARPPPRRCLTKLKHVRWRQFWRHAHPRRPLGPSVCPAVLLSLLTFSTGLAPPTAPTLPLL